MGHLRRAAAAVLLALFLPLALATTAHAESFRYWGYYQWADGTWAFAQTGPSESVPADGTVEGWRFAVTDETSTRTPRTDVTFEDLCANTDPIDDRKRVAVVIDYGTAEDAPPDAGETPQARGDCAQVPEEATGADVLAAVAQVRSGDGGLTCALDGYPASGCGDAVDEAAPTGEEASVDLALPGDAASDESTEPTAGGETGETSEPGGSTIALIAGIVAILAVALAAFVRMRRSPTE